MRPQYIRLKFPAMKVGRLPAEALRRRGGDTGTGGGAGGGVRGAVEEEVAESVKGPLGSRMRYVKVWIISLCAFTTV